MGQLGSSGRDRRGVRFGRWSRGLLPAFLLVGLLVLSAPVEAQVPGRGTLTVQIVDLQGRALQGVQVRLGDAESDDSAREITTSSTGLANFLFVTAGARTLAIERLGYVPARVNGVEIVAGGRDRIRIELREAAPPVTEVDEYAFFGLVERHRTSGLRLLSGSAAHLPGARAAFAPLLDAASATPELPGRLPLRYLRTDTDGIPFSAAGPPRTGPGFEGFAPFPPYSLERVAVHASAPVPGGLQGPGPVLELTGRGGGDRIRGRLGGGGSFSEGSAGGVIAPWLSGVVSGPLVGDTVTMSAGFSFERMQTPLPGLLATDESNREALLEGFGGEDGGLPAETRPVRALDLLRGHARMDWAIGEASSLMVQAYGAMIPESDALLAPPLPEFYSSTTAGSDVSTSSRLLYVGEDGTALEVSLGASRSSRTSGTGLTSASSEMQGNAFANEGAFVGPFRDMSGEFSLSTVTFSPVGMLIGDRYELRAGAVGVLRRWSDQRVSRIDRRFLHLSSAIAGSAPMLQRRLELSSRDLSISQSQLGFFAEARWWPTEDLRLAGGARIDREFLPRESFDRSPIFEEATGINRRAIDPEPAQFSPAGEIQWTPSALPGWSVTARGELQPGSTDPALLGEVIREGGGTTGVVDFGSAGRSDGYQLHLLGPSFHPPRGELLSLRVESSLSSRVSAGIELFRHRSDFLPRRRDLNRSPGVGVTDQFGRMHVGDITSVDGLIAIEPGSDRRFPEFHEIWAFESDGWSETLGASVGVTVELDGALVEANYTRSRTRDNAPFGLTGWSNPTSGFLGPDSRDAEWVEGRSDDDRPHRMNVLGTIELPISAGSRVSWRYQLSSGRPFTPGVRDALGTEWEEGWTRLQPIALPDGATLPTSGSGWSCSTELGAGDRMERNACRGEPLHTLDLRLDFALPAIGGQSLTLRADALNLLDHVDVIRDPALFIVDGSGGADPAVSGSRVTLPVMENPTFGQPLARLPGGRTFRFGLEYRF